MGYLSEALRGSLLGQLTDGDSPWNNDSDLVPTELYYFILSQSYFQVFRVDSLS